MSGDLKMRRAVGTRGTLHRIDGLQKRHDTQQTLPTLLCDSEGCGASVRFVAAEPSYIALAKGAEHQPSCRYNAAGRLQAILAAGSDPDFLPSLDDGRHELRLLLPQQALKRGGAEQQTVDGYLGTLADLLVLRAMCERDDLVASQVILRLGKKRVDWENFFYDQERYDQAWERIGTGTTDLPMALVDTVRSHRAPQPGSLFLNCAPKYQHTGVADRRDFYEVSVGHADAAWLKSFPMGAEIVMFGLWRQGRSSTSSRPHPTDPRRTITNVTHKLALWPGFKRQLALVE
ncbi:hypothetical protein ACGFZ3_01115 [Stenotrophomonas sp. NPDC047960]|uniref:hypothetical protein n=1 Tax=Stenotrophomonas sp. NPDC047960 TaxID=3364531 RepID=UPI003715F7A3